MRRFEETKTVDDLPNRGLKRGTATREDKAIVQLYKKYPTLSLRKAQGFLRKKNINVSILTIKRRLEEKGISWRSTIRKPLLSSKHVEKRLKWARENVNRDWDNVVFTDECSFWGWLPVRKAWSVQGMPVIQRTVKHAIKLHVWGCFNVRGFGTLCLFTDNLNAMKMKKII